MPKRARTPEELSAAQRWAAQLQILDIPVADQAEDISEMYETTITPSRIYGWRKMDGYIKYLGGLLEETRSATLARLVQYGPHLAELSGRIGMGEKPTHTQQVDAINRHLDRIIQRGAGPRVKVESITAGPAAFRIIVGD